MKLRIGKDFSMRWEITTDGAAIPLEGRDLTVELKSPIGVVSNIPFRVDGNVLIMTYSGYRHKVIGEYSITLWENKGKFGQNVVDAIRAFELVRTSQEEDDFIAGDLQIESVDLGTANFDILTEGGYRAINIDTLQAEALEDVVNINGKTYGEESFTITLPKANLDKAGVMCAADVRTLQEHTESIATINTTLEEHTESIASNKTSCEENAAEIERVSDVVDTHEGRLDNIDTTLASHATQIGNATENIEFTNSALSALQSKVDANTTSVDSINNTLTSHATQINNNTTSIANKDSEIAQINTKLQEHTESIASNKTSCEENAAEIERVSDVVDTHEGRLDNIDTTLASHATQIGNATENIEFTNSALSALQSKVDANTTSVDSINNTLTSHATQINNNTTSIANKDSEIAQINTKLQEHTESIASNKTSCDANAAEIERVSDVAENIQSTITALALDLEESLSYGIQFDTSISSPNCTRIGSSTMHKTLPIQSKMQGCLLRDDGTVERYLNASDWTSETRDGSAGQVMVEIPEHYRKCTQDGTICTVRLSELPIEGYQKIPKMYVSAYEASIQRSTGKLCSVVNEATDYRGGNNNANYDGTYRSFLGRPVTSISRKAFRTAARKRKSGSSEWNCYLYQVHKALFWLFTVEYATLNSQAAFNAELTSEGYRQGGLGAGVSDWSSSDWSTFNGYYPFVPCGHTDTLGNSTGVVAYTAYNADGSELKTSNVPRYRGIENPFGHIYKWTDGINVRISPTEANGGDNLSKVFVCEDPSKLNDTNYNGYKHVGNEARTEGYVKEIIFGEEGEIMPSLVGGGSTQFFCDYHYTSIPTTETLRGVLFGGLALNGASAGLVSAHSYNVPSTPSAYFGSRLCFIPATA